MTKLANSEQGVQLHKMSFWKSKNPEGPTGHFASHAMGLTWGMLEDCIQKHFGSKGDHWLFSLAPDSLAELTQQVELEIQPRGSKKTRKTFLYLLLVVLLQWEKNCQRTVPLNCVQ